MIPWKDHEWIVMLAVRVNPPFTSYNDVFVNVDACKFSPEDVKCFHCGQRYANAKDSKCPGRRVSTGA